MALGTPLSMQAIEGAAHAGQPVYFAPYAQGQQQQTMPPSFQNYTGFAPVTTHEQQQASFAPATFMNHDTSFDSMDQDGSPMHGGTSLGQMEAAMQPPMMTYQPRQFEINTAAQLPESAEKFRFHVVLNAPTAMVSHADEIPVTYLNKGQAYSVSIVDTQPMLPLPVGTRYRTFIRISFEDDQQRQKPASCWQLWKEGRGTNEAHQRGGKLQAVEYVESTQHANSDDKRTTVELESASFDGFSVVWTPSAAGLAECSLAVRFNFLSTDFSHSKGVKGIPVRCCAKTEVLDPSSPHAIPGSTEVAYCKVKLFRDHGAERKLSNDVQHVKKTIDKLKQQIAQSEAGLKDFGKRKRTGSVSKAAAASQRAGKVPKHKRTWSMSSTSSAGGHVPIEEDLHFKLQQQQDMFTSTRPVSILYLRGDEHDDPDLHPVALAGEPWDLTKVDARDAAWHQRTSVRSSSTAETSSLVSPSPSSTSLHSQAMAGSSIPVSAQWGGDYHAILGADVSSNPQHLASPPDQLTKVQKTDDAGSLSGWIEALGVDASYRPPVDRAPKPVACFYLQQRDATAAGGKKSYYRAVYLAQRTLGELLDGITTKWGIDPTSVRRTLHVMASGLEVEVDDDVVREMREGQDVVFEVKSLAAQVKREWDMSVDEGEEERREDGCEIRLMF